MSERRPKIQIDITPPGGDVTLLAEMLDEYDNLKECIVDELSSMIRLNRKATDGRSISSTSHRLKTIDVTVHYRDESSTPNTYGERKSTCRYLPNLEYSEKRGG